uniref:Uncharacterized protein n=1 Tax=Sipha flava TaxID=143950 RepID=A0A2S2QJF7_9HEMI
MHCSTNSGADVESGDAHGRGFGGDNGGSGGDDGGSGGDGGGSGGVAGRGRPRPSCSRCRHRSTFGARGTANAESFGGGHGDQVTTRCGPVRTGWIGIPGKRDDGEKRTTRPERSAVRVADAKPELIAYTTGCDTVATVCS